jgi:dolichyl-phosphate beta-glucosyltransferase
VVIDDGSTDRTASVASRYSGVRLLTNPGNRGKGYSVRHGMLEANGDWLLLSDADLSTPIEEVEKLWEAAGKAGAQVVIGSRALNRTLIGVHQPWAREYVGRFFNVFMRALTDLPFHDTQCGFKLFERNAARSIFERQLLNGFGFDVEVLLLANKLGYRTVEVPVRWNDVPGTKVSTLLGLDAFADVFRVRWNQLTGKYK